MIIFSSKMKTQYALVALSIIFGFTFAFEEIFLATKKCQGETNLTKAEYDEAMGSRPIKTDNEKVKCTLKCLLMELKWMDDKAIIKPAPGIKIPQDEIDEVFPCLKVNGTDACDKAFNFFKCDIEEREKHGQ